MKNKGISIAVVVVVVIIIATAVGGYFLFLRGDGEGSLSFSVQNEQVLPTNGATDFSITIKNTGDVRIEKIEVAVIGGNNNSHSFNRNVTITPENQEKIEHDFISWNTSPGEELKINITAKGQNQSKKKQVKTTVS